MLKFCHKIFMMVRVGSQISLGKICRYVFSMVYLLIIIFAHENTLDLIVVNGNIMSLNLMTSLVLNYSPFYQRILDPNIKYYSSKIFMSSDKILRDGMHICVGLTTERSLKCTHTKTYVVI